MIEKDLCDEIQWSEALSVGDATIDSQHKELFSKIEILCKNENEKDTKLLRGMLDYLNQYIFLHFRHEEAYMKEHNFPQLIEHQKMHKNFVSKHDQMVINFLDPNSEIVLRDLEEFLVAWWTGHVAGADAKYHKYIDENKKSHPKDEEEDYHETIQH